MSMRMYQSRRSSCARDLADPARPMWSRAIGSGGSCTFSSNAGRYTQADRPEPARPGCNAAAPPSATQAKTSCPRMGWAWGGRASAGRNSDRCCSAARRCFSATAMARGVPQQPDGVFQQPTIRLPLSTSGLQQTKKKRPVAGERT